MLCTTEAEYLQGMANGYVRLSHLSKHLLTFSQQPSSTRFAAGSYQPLLAHQVSHCSICLHVHMHVFHRNHMQMTNLLVSTHMASHWLG